MRYLPLTDVFKIGGADFDFAPETTVTFQDGGIAFRLIGCTVPYDETLHAAAFRRVSGENPRPGAIAPAFQSSVFHFYDNRDVAARRLSYPKKAPGAQFDDFYLRCDGFRYGTEFFGEVDLRTDRVELCGVLRGGVDDDEVSMAEEVSIRVVRHFSAASVEFLPYTYCSLEEALAAPVERVRRLYLGDWNGRWIEELSKLAKLEELTLENIFVRTTECPVWPDTFGSLTQLRRLHIRGADFLRLPSCFGNLSRLEELSLTYGRLEDLPASFAQLVGLKRLSLDGNRLGTLPDFIGRLPALVRVSLNDNPFTALPASLCAIPQINIEKKNEALFRDISYRPGVDVQIDRDALAARSSALHVGRVTDILARYGLERYRGAVLRQARQALRLRTTLPEDYALPGNTRIGGAPDLPPDVPYPMTDEEHWRFYAQIDLEAIAPFQSWLPREGWLYFFAEGGGGMQQGDSVRVLYWQGSRDTLRTYIYPDDAEFADDGDAHPGFKVEVDATVSIPFLNAAAEKRLLGEEAILLQITEDDDLLEAYWAVVAELTDDESGNGAHLMNAHVFTQSETPEEEASRQAGGLPAEWVNLLTLVSADPRPGFCFWDAGTLTFCIHEKDLALADFSRTVWHLESS